MVFAMVLLTIGAITPLSAQCEFEEGIDTPLELDESGIVVDTIPATLLTSNIYVDGAEAGWIRDGVFVADTDQTTSTPGDRLNPDIDTVAIKYTTVGTYTVQRRKEDFLTGCPEENGSVQTTVAQPSPITLLLQEFLIKDDLLTISFQTASEENNKGFSIEVSEDGMAFSPLAFVKSNSVDGNSSAIQKYALEIPIERLTTVIHHGNKAYLRITNIDYDGTEYHNPIEVVRLEERAIKSYYSSEVGLTIDNPSASSYAAQVLSIEGSTIATFTIAPYSQQVISSLVHLPQGTYVLIFGNSNSQLFIVH